VGFAITNNRSEGRFEIACEERLALLEYKVTGTLMTLLHTEVPESLNGKGFGGKLVKFALEYAEQNNLDVVAQCEFAQSYIKRHKEYSPLLGSA
jgi:uncharacterized protein